AGKPIPRQQSGGRLPQNEDKTDVCQGLPDEIRSVCGVKVIWRGLKPPILRRSRIKKGQIRFRAILLISLLRRKRIVCVEKEPRFLLGSANLRMIREITEDRGCPCF